MADRILFQNLTFVDTPPDEMEVECPICFQVMTDDPRLISCCGHHFCGFCINRIESQGGSCPLCNATEFNTMSDKGLSRRINGLTVYCTYKTRGCDWKGPIKDIKAHHAAGKREGPCSYAEVSCQHFRCNVKTMRSKLLDHEKSCSLRPFTCQHCRSYADAYNAVISYHYRICGAFPLKCPNDCGVNDIPRDNMEKHFGECTLAVVECEFKWAGCTITDMKRKDLGDHLSSNTVEHLSLLSRACFELKKENEQLKSQQRRKFETS